MEDVIFYERLLGSVAEPALWTDHEGSTFSVISSISQAYMWVYDQPWCHVLIHGLDELDELSDSSCLKLLHKLSSDLFLIIAKKWCHQTRNLRAIRAKYYPFQVEL